MGLCPIPRQGSAPGCIRQVLGFNLASSAGLFWSNMNDCEWSEAAAIPVG